jgi:hypothetical protein
MKAIRVTATPDLAVAPRPVEVLLDTTVVTEARLLDWTVSEAVTTALFAVTGDPQGLREALRGTSPLEWIDVTAVDDEHCYLLATMRRDDDPIFRAVMASLSRAGLVVVKPVRYRDGAVQARLVGDPAALQTALEAMPAAMDLQVDAVGARLASPWLPVGELTERQYETVATALSLGYYDTPRAATHDDVAAALDCAPSTVSEHLQKAEAALVRAAIDGW